ncbi:MAG: hypothetical protein H6738_25315 [Alphaproteobacteria bacterium]|nr:hypothetical protein [Alphaproteobacteria bacterium]MCB9700133.1 hypothetical protein [Alphaproteobacteria bacterium]
MWFVAVAMAQSETLDDEDPALHTALLWQGFRHDWERHAAVGLHVPHRVGRFESRIGPAVHTRTADGWRTEAPFRFAQSTGVDGDWMFPEGYVGRVSSPDLRVTTGVVTLRTDASRVQGDHPRALERFHEVLSIPKGPEPVEAATVLQGLSFRSWCVEDETACHSDGLWPYRFEVDLQPCEDLGDTLACPVEVEVGRAWTPARGGIRGIEEKPLEPTMGLEIEVGWALLTASPGALLALPWHYENALPSTRAMTLTPQIARIAGLPTGFPAAAVAFTGLAFELFPPSGRSSRQERGRYIGGWSARLEVADWDADTGTVALSHAGGLWLPRTVRRSAVSIDVGATLLLLAHPEARVDPPVTVRGALCSPSHDAPWFSAWNRCEALIGEGERTEQEVRVTVPPEP